MSIHQRHNVVKTASVENALLRALTFDDFEVLRPFFQSVELKKGMLLTDSNKPLEFVYFIESGIVSIMTRSHRDGALEVAMIGKAGVVGASAALGTTMSGHRACVQISGRALRISIDAFVQAVEEHPAIRLVMMKYIQSLIIQISQTAFCNARHSAKEKIARWLLLAKEYAGSDNITVTHDLLGTLLNTRRAAVTHVLCALESNGIVSRARGSIRISDPQRLVDQSCACRTQIMESSAWLGPAREHSHLIRSEMTCHEQGGKSGLVVHDHCQVDEFREQHRPPRNTNCAERTE